MIIWECKIINWNSDLEIKIHGFLHENVSQYKSESIYNDIPDEELKYVAEHGEEYHIKND